MTHLITICTNTEHLMSHFDTAGLPSEVLDDLAIEWCDQVATIISDAAACGLAVEYTTCRDFGAYTGGRFAEQAPQQGNMPGTLSCKRDAPRSVQRLCFLARERADADLEAAVAKEVAEMRAGV